MWCLSLRLPLQPSSNRVEHARLTTRHPGYLISQQKRKRTEEIFGWLKTVAGLRKTRHRGGARVGWMFRFSLAAYNSLKMRKLLPAAA
jgi:hypothetical protein